MVQQHLNFTQQPGCTRCGRTEYRDDTGRVIGQVTWMCCFCGELVCRYCTLVRNTHAGNTQFNGPGHIRGSSTYYDDTYCSEECKNRKEMEREIPEIMES